MVCRFYFDTEVIRIIVFVRHSLVIKNIRYDQHLSLESELEIRSAPCGSCIDVVLRCVQWNYNTSYKHFWFWPQMAIYYKYVLKAGVTAYMKVYTK